MMNWRRAAASAELQRAADGMRGAARGCIGTLARRRREGAEKVGWLNHRSRFGMGNKEG